MKILNHPRGLTSLVFGLILEVSFASPTAAWTNGTATFTSLGDLPGGTFDSYANDVSADGSVVVGTSSTATGYEAFRWTAETGMISLGGPNTSAAGVSADGSVIVGFHKNGAEAMRWTEETGIVGLGHLASGGMASQAQGVSGDGTVVVAYSGSDSFRWTAETGMIGIGGTVACCISADGQVIAGTIGTFTTNEVFRWTAESGIVPLGDLPGGNFDTVARGISADGRVIVGTGRSGKEPLVNEAFRWAAETGMIGLGTLHDDTFESCAYAVSADGSIIVGEDISTSFLRHEAFIWTDTDGMRSLQDLLVNNYGLAEPLKGWTLERPLAITPDGLTIVGFGRNSNGQQEAWRMQFVIPEPGALALVIVAIALTLFHGRLAPSRFRTTLHAASDI